MGLKHPVCSKVQWRFGDEFFTAGTVTCPNGRKTYEDTHIMTHNRKKYNNIGDNKSTNLLELEKEEIIGSGMIVGVFDGHGGDCAAQFLKIQVPNRLKDMEINSKVLYNFFFL